MVTHYPPALAIHRVEAVQQRPTTAAIAHNYHQRIGADELPRSHDRTWPAEALGVVLGRLRRYGQGYVTSATDDKRHLSGGVVATRRALDESDHLAPLATPPPAPSPDLPLPPPDILPHDCRCSTNRDVLDAEDLLAVVAWRTADGPGPFDLRGGAEVRVLAAVDTLVFARMVALVFNPDDDRVSDAVGVAGRAGGVAVVTALLWRGGGV
jgi:hypothetical protein